MSALGLMGWPHATVKEICAKDAPVRYGILQPGPDIVGGVPYVRPKEIDNHEIDLSSLRRTTPEIAEQYRRSSLLPGDIILSIVGTIGKVAKVPEELMGGNITQSSARIRVDQSKMLPDFLAYLLKSPVLVEQFNTARMGTAVQRLNIAHVRALRVPLPPLSEQRRIVGLLDEAFAGLATATANARRKLDLLDELKRVTLHRAFACASE
jgi:type I restriction enzyme S subunit